MPGLILHTGDHLEDLVPVLLENLRGSLPDDPLESVFVVVPGPGLGQWLLRSLARICGSATGIECVLKNTLGIAREAAADPDLARSLSLWLSGELVRGSRALPPPLLGKASGDPGNAAALAQNLGQVFARYAHYAPEWLESWQNNPSPTDWQALIWRQFFNQARPAGWPVSWTQAGHGMPPATAPRHYFGFIPFSGPELASLRLLAEKTEVHLYRLQPSDLDWMDWIGSRKAVLNLQSLPAASPLLASWAQLESRILRRLVDLDAEIDPSGFRPPTTESLLTWLKRDLAAPPDSPVMPPRESPEDLSIIIAATSGVRRELEALQDHLLNLVRTMPGLRWDDVLVLAPEPGRFERLLPAVFGSRRDTSGLPLIPWRIAESHPLEDAPVTSAFLASLELAAGRITASDFLAWLELATVREGLGIDESRLGEAGRWIDRLGTAWGLDANHREAFGVPPEPRHTWMEAKRSLLLGHAFSADKRDAWDGTLPYPDVEGDGITLADSLIRAIDLIARVSGTLAEGRTPADWRLFWIDLVDRLCPRRASENTVDRPLLIRAFEEWEASLHASLAETPLPAALALESLRTVLRQPRRQGGGLSGGVSFGRLQTGRAVPARVLCLIGLDENALNASSRLVNDRLAQAQTVSLRPPDPRESSGHALMEALLCAREALYISYQGLDPTDKSEIPPAPLVADLIERLEGNLDERSLARVLRRHTLQSHSPAAFAAGAPPSFNREAWQTAQVRQKAAESDKAVPVHEPTLIDTLKPTGTLSLETLAEWGSRPAVWHLRERLGVRLGADWQPARTSEPFDVDPLGHYHLMRLLFEECLGPSGGVDWERLQRLAQAHPSLPLGAPGADHVESLLRELRHGLAVLPGGLLEMPGMPAELRLEFRREGESLLITGTAGWLVADQLLLWSPGRLRARGVFEFWLRHLSWSAQVQGSGGKTLILGREGFFELPQVASAHERLLPWLDTFFSREPRPPFLPSLSIAFAHYSPPLRTKRMRKSAIEHAIDLFDQSITRASEAKDEAVGLLYPDVSDLVASERFQEFALRCVSPMLQAFLDAGWKP